MGTIKVNKSFKKNHFEKLAWQNNTLICGIDEVGRGCLAGPVVTAAVILKPGKSSPCLKDSKILTQKELQKAYKWLAKNAIFSTSLINHRDIDLYNIYHATLRAMKRAVVQLFAQSPQLPSLIVADAMPIDLQKTGYEHIDVYHFPFGEKQSSSIAAASIIAKVTRDALMKKISSSFPHYYFDKHKGYGTRLHQQSISNFGSSIIHRKRFLTNKSFNHDEGLLNDNVQQTIC